VVSYLIQSSSGAGDSFLGALVHYLNKKCSMNEAVQRACAVASLSVTKEGCQPSYANREEVQLKLGF
jgi:ribokinase